MSSLSDFLSISSGSAKTAYYTTSGTKTLVTHGGKDKLVYIVRGENDGYWVRADGEALYDRDVVKVTADFSFDVGLSADAIGTVQGSFSSPASSPLGVAFDNINKNLITGDSGTDTIYVHDGFSSNILNSFSSPASSISGLYFEKATGNLISCDFVSGLIYVHDSVTSSILNSFSSPGSSPAGVCVDEKTGNLVSCDNSNNLIYIHDGISSTILESFSGELSSPRGLSIDLASGDLISNYTGSDEIYIHSGITSNVVSSFTSPSSNVGIGAFDDEGYFLFSTSSDNMIYQVTSPSQRAYAAIKYIVQDI